MFFYAFSQFAIFRARRYRATRTVWRCVRFWMTGSGWDYAWRACPWSLLTLLTLGFALPWREAALERYKMRHLHYGDLSARFEGAGWDLFKCGWWLWLLLILSLVAGLVFRRAAIVGTLSTLLFIASPFLYAAYKAILWRWWIRGIRFADLRFESDLRVDALMDLYWATIGWMLLLAVIYAGTIALAAVLMPILFSGHFNMAAITVLARLHPYVFFATNLAIYLVYALCAGIVMRVYLIRGVWERVVNSTTAHDLECADDVRARGDLVSALGEGFADGLDVVGF